ncbi:g-type lectin s-receptor-like serine/threonine-protein kinase ces101 [Quercus suber]|uniref:G-type lectin s-receptor-like serine/threonine-protein kinase ces101 n=1 Tax=Quercus suber TaxID=58331 RepID=A0AAW0KLI5_QUESU
MANIVVNLLFIYYFTRFIETAYSESNTLVQGQQLKDGQYLASASGNYKLGFFSGSGRKRYVGIWHKHANVKNAATDWKPLWAADNGRNPSTRGIWDEQDNLGSSRAAEKPVWVANRNNPVLDNSGILTIGSDGHLKILHDGGVEIVLFSAPLENNASATLLDSGNFVVHELNSDGSIKQVVALNCKQLNLLVLFVKFKLKYWYEAKSFRDGEHLASSGGTFRLEFFSPGSSRNRYVGISFNIADGVLLVANKKVVWVTNRDNPIADKSGILMIDELGNFILREQNSDGSTRQVLWQSFDYPTDTLLPGMKLGISMKTTDIWSLTWWISENNPAKGTFTLTAGFNMDDESMLVIWWQGNTYWISGNWQNGHFEFVPRLSNVVIWWQGNTYWISGNWQNGHFEFVPRLSNERDISFSYISNENEKYFTYYLNKIRTLSRYMIDFTGAILEMTGLAPFSASACSYGSYPGCMKQQLPACRKPNDQFKQRKGVMSGEGFKFDGNYNMSLSDCRAKCLDNCSCIAYAATDYDDTSCTIWSKGVNFKESNNSYSLDVYFLVQEKDILVQGQKLRDGEHLASSGGTFRLEFFSPGSSRNRYVGISFNIADGVLLVANKKVVWVTNRDNPIADKSGNFILREQNSDGSTRQVLWQSFDCPTDTLLPGMKLGISMKTTDIWSLTWWISESNPAKGTFTLTAGFNMDDENFTGAILEMRGLAPFGAGDCSNGSYPGCVKQQLPACRKPNDQFEQRKGVMSGEGFKFDGNYNMSLFDCRAKCLNNCSCIAYAATDYNETSCTIWSKGVNFKESNNSYSLDVYFLVQEKGKFTSDVSL